MIRLYPFKYLSNNHRIFLCYLCFLLIAQLPAFEVYADSINLCNGTIVNDLTTIEQTLTFSRPEIADDHDGYLGFFQVVGSDGTVLKDFLNVEALRQRALEYSKNKCAPERIVYPDVVLVIELYENGKISSSTEYENGGKVIKVERLYKPAGVLFAEYPYQDGKINGMAKFYHENGKLNYEQNYKDNMRDGCFESHHQSGETKGVGCFANNMLTGTYRHFYQNGIEEIVAQYSLNGNLDGDYIERYGNGNHRVKGFYKEGKLDGGYNEWFENGNVRIVAKYANGKMKDEAFVYFENGSVSEHFNNGSTQQPGQYNRFFEDGSLLSKVPVINGEYEGNYEEFDKNGKIIATGSYKAGAISGSFKKFYKNGEIQLESEYKNGIEILTTSYFEHGGVKQRVFYDGNGEIEHVDVYDNYGALDIRFPYKDGKLDGMVNKFYRDGSIAITTHISQGKINNPVVAYDQQGNETYKINYDEKGEIRNFGILGSSGEIVHFFIKEDNTMKQYEFYPDGSLKFSSKIDIEGNEKREFYDFPNNELKMTQKFTASDGLINIFYIGNGTIGCVKLEHKDTFDCFDKSKSDELKLMDTQISMDFFIWMIKHENFTKPEIHHLIDISSEESIVNKNNETIIPKTVNVNSLGQHCYNLGFMEYCQ